jgi:hypothetical protein
MCTLQKRVASERIAYDERATGSRFREEDKTDTCIIF